MITADTHPETYELARAVPGHLIKPPAPGKFGDYVPHFVVQQIITAAVGPFDWELVEIVRGPSYGTKNRGKPDEETVVVENAVVAVIYRMTVEVDGRRVVIEETGHADNAWKEPDDGARLKKAASDAMKRCGMRLGVALHLWCKRPEEFFLPRVLRERTTETDHVDEPEPVVGLIDDEEPTRAAESLQEPGTVDYAQDDPGRPFVTDQKAEAPETVESGSEPVVDEARQIVEEMKANLRAAGVDVDRLTKPEDDPDKAPETVEEAEANLLAGGLVDPVTEDGKVRLPTGKVVPHPVGDEAWTIETKKAFIDYAQGAESGKSLYLALASEALLAAGQPVGEMPEAEILAWVFSEAECWALLTTLTA